MLESLLSVLNENAECVLTLDKRLPLPPLWANDIRVKRIRPTIFQRFNAERWIARSVKSDDTVLCFGNLPPLFKLRGRAVVFLQNRYLIDDVELRDFPLKTRLRLSVERLWLSARLENADEFIVQTPSMKRLLEKRTMGNIPIRILPFMANHVGYERKELNPKKKKEKDICFIYVASGEPHKNHRRLIEAWCLLASEELFPTLKLTLDRTLFAELCSWMEQKIEQNRLIVENVGSLPHEQVQQLYEQADALIYPSTFESFGLPLIEARQAGLSVLASELDYVRDVLDPEQTFDPESPISIVRAVKRFMGMDEQSLPLLDATAFMASVFGKAG